MWQWKFPWSEEERQTLSRITETARNNHEELFPHRTSTLLVTDPELIEVFDNFAFDEVLASDNLETRTRLMVILASLIASQALTEYRVMLAGALNVGVTPVEIKEIVYQAVPYVGMVKVFDFLHATNEVLTERGVPLPLPGQSTTTPETRTKIGLEVQKHIVGDAVVEHTKIVYTFVGSAGCTNPAPLGVYVVALADPALALPGTPFQQQIYGNVILVGGRDPAWSPDGQHIAVTYQGHTAVMDPDGNNIHETAGNFGLVSWSPDSQLWAVDSGFVNADGTNYMAVKGCPCTFAWR